ncbi:MAG TPA: hypothetical protein VIB47_13715 [Dehalococcoidia bacterium]
MEYSLSPEAEKAPPPGGPARIFAGLAFFYALIVTVVLLLLKHLFRDEPDGDTVLVWLLLPLLGSFGSWIAVRSGFSPLRAWVWFAVLASMFFVWISVFSIGVLYLPVPLLLMVAVLTPWRHDGGEDGN